MGTIDSMPTNFGNLPKVREQQEASTKAKFEKKPPDEALRGVRLHVYYIHFGQYIHPIGSDRPLWVAGEYFLTLSISCTTSCKLPTSPNSQMPVRPYARCDR